MACGIRCALAVAPAAAAAAAALFVPAAALADVRQERQLAGALHRAGDLVLVAPAGAGDAARADLAAVRDELAEADDVLVVDELDLDAAVLAGLAPAAASSGLAITPARRPAALLRHCWKTSSRASRSGAAASRARGRAPYAAPDRTG